MKKLLSFITPVLGVATLAFLLPVTGYPVPHVTIVLDELPTPPPITQSPTTENEDIYLFYEQVDEWILSARDMVGPMRDSVRNAVYIRSDFKCFVATPEEKDSWIRNAALVDMTLGHLSEALSRIVDRNSRILVPNRLDVFVAPEKAFTCRVKLKEWGTPYYNSRPVSEIRNPLPGRSNPSRALRSSSRVPAPEPSSE